MKQRKICMLGGFAVGKTSLVRRFVHSLYTGEYHTTIGVKVEKKTVALSGGDVTLMLWDIHGDDALQRVRRAYLRGSSGYLLVVDGTRRETLTSAQALHALAVDALGAVPFVLVLNKSDLLAQWDIEGEALRALASRSLLTIRTSALAGHGVEGAFRCLAEAVLGDNPAAATRVAGRKHR